MIFCFCLVLFLVHCIACKTCWHWDKWLNLVMEQQVGERRNFTHVFDRDAKKHGKSIIWKMTYFHGKMWQGKSTIKRFFKQKKDQTKFSWFMGRIISSRFNHFNAWQWLIITNCICKYLAFANTFKLNDLISH